MTLAGLDRKDGRQIRNFFLMALKDRYMGSALGSLWSIANPLLMFSLFTFLFGFVYKVRLPGAETTLAYAMWLIAGYGPWIAMQESIMAAGTSVVGAASIVKNVAMKVEILPIANVLVGVIPLSVSFVFLLALMVSQGEMPTWHALLLPLVVGVQLLLLFAIGFVISAACVFFRDLTYALPNLLMILLLATPILYPAETIPRVLRMVSQFNPFYIIAESYRAVLLRHQVPDLIALLCVGAASIFIAWIALRAFRRIKGLFEAAL